MTSSPKVERPLGLCLTGGGAVCLAVALGCFWETYSFRSHAVSTTGTVVGYVESLTRDSHNQIQHLYAPRFRFVTAEGRQVEQVSRHSAAAPDPIGSLVAVRYWPSNPQNAELDSLLNWAFAGLFGFVGAFFFVPGVVFLLRVRSAARLRVELLAHGTEVRARFVGVRRNGSVEYNGRSPWRVLCQWQDPSDARVYVFSSDDIWFDPSAYIPGEDLQVFIDPLRPEHHHVDLSFLPPAAD